MFDYPVLLFSQKTGVIPESTRKTGFARMRCDVTFTWAKGTSFFEVGIEGAGCKLSHNCSNYSEINTLLRFSSQLGEQLHLTSGSVTVSFAKANRITLSLRRMV